MMKFFRKYNKHLIAVFMSLLMIVFVGGSALEGLLAPDRNQLLADSGRGTITEMDIRVTTGTTDILERLGLGWQLPFPGASEPLTAVDWILLTREAEDLGAQRDTPVLRNILMEQFGADAVGDFARRLRIKPEQIVQAFGQLQSVQEVARAVAGAVIPSEAEIRVAASRVLDKVWITAVLLPARMFVEEDEEFTEEVLAAHLEQYREQRPGNGLEFGYFVPDAVKVQYIQIDSKRLAETIGVANLESKAKKYFRENREIDRAFRRPPEELPQEPFGDDGSEEANEAIDEPSPFLDWEEAKAIAVNSVRRQHAEEAAGRIADWLLQQLSEVWFDTERGEDGYKTTPDGVADLEHYQATIDRIPASIAFPEAVLEPGTTGFFAQDKADRIAGLGAANFRPARGAPARLGALAFLVKGIVEEVPTGRDVNREEYLAAFQTCPYPLKDQDGNFYVFRVIEVRKGHPAESLDPIRGVVRKDLRLLRGFERAKSRAEGLRGCHADLGLQEAYDSDEELLWLRETPEGAISGYFEPPPFARVSRYAAASGRTTPTTYIPGGVGLVPNSVVDLCFALEEADDKTAVVELRERAAILLIEWLKTEPGRDDEFEEMRGQLATELIAFRGRQAVAEWLAPEKIRARNGLMLAEGLELR